jgi:hypothetical protein
MQDVLDDPSRRRQERRQRHLLRLHFLMSVVSLSAPAAAAGLALPLCSEKPSAPTPHTGLVVSSEPPGGVDGAGEK